MTAAFLYGLVILSAIAHAVWNAMMKHAGDRAMMMVAIRSVGLILGLAALPFVEWPAAVSWKWLALTVLVQFAYFVLLVRSYSIGDMSVVYPLARGLAPVLTTIAALLFAGEALTTGQMVAVGLISLGIMVLSVGRQWGSPWPPVPALRPTASWPAWARGPAARCWAFRPARKW